jgi:hypothetical protein
MVKAARRIYHCHKQDQVYLPDLWKPINKATSCHHSCLLQHLPLSLSLLLLLLLPTLFHNHHQVQLFDCVQALCWCKGIPDSRCEGEVINVQHMSEKFIQQDCAGVLTCTTQA